MSRLRSMSRSGWVVVGLVLGAIAIPAVAVAATATLVTIRGNNHNAAVSPAGQLRTVTMDPANTFHTESYVGDAACVPLFTVPADKSVVIRHINVSVFDTPTNETNRYLNVITGTCGQTPTSFLADVRITGQGPISIPLGDGISLPAGTQVNGFFLGADGFVDLFGYTMGANAVPASAIHNSGPAHVRQPAKGR
jgi:hypothetical protein